jgi:hypothetical protein
VSVFTALAADKPFLKEELAHPPYTVKRVPAGSLVLNRHGMNCVAFEGKPGAVIFEDDDEADAFAKGLE